MRDFIDSERSQAAFPPGAYGDAVEALRALAPLNTLVCLALLLDGEMCVGELQDAMGRSQSHVSQILRVLRSRGLVRVRVERNTRCYTLADTPAVTVLRQIAGRLGLHPSGMPS